MRINRLISVVCAVTAGAALALSVMLVLLARRQYGETLAAKVWPAGESAAVTAGTTVSGPRTVLLLGDSRIADWGLPQIEGCRVLNAGMPGITSAQLALRCREILEQTRPQMVLIQVGINDLKLLGVRADLREAVSSGCVSNILAVVRECRRIGARVVVTPVWPAGAVTLARRFVWSDAVDPAVAETNARLQRLLANEEGVRVADLFAELARGLSTEQRSRLYRDTLHLNPETYARLSALLAKTIAAWPDDTGRPARPDAANPPDQPDNP